MFFIDEEIKKLMIEFWQGYDLQKYKYFIAIKKHTVINE